MPHPTTMYKFLLGLEAIGMIVKGNEKGMKVYESYYQAVRFAEITSSWLDFDEKYTNGDLTYTVNSKCHILIRLAKAFCRHAKMEEVPQEIIDWLNDYGPPVVDHKIDIRLWTGDSIFIKVDWTKGSATIVYNDDKTPPSFLINTLKGELAEDQGVRVANKFAS